MQKLILLVEDDHVIAEAVEAYLLKSGYQVISVVDGLRALEVFKAKKPDMILLDLMLPGLTGEEICKEVRKDSNVPILMLTAKAKEDDIISGLNLGADDYMTKPFSPRELVARVNSLFRRSHEHRKILSWNHDDLTIDLESYEVKKQGNPVSLTQSEYKILITLAKNQNRVFTREDLITYAFDDDFDGYDRTIDSHIKNLRSKIETTSNHPIYIKTIRGVGYKFGGDAA